MAKFRGARPTRPAFSDKEKPHSKPVSDNDQRPVFSFEHMPQGSGWSVNCCQLEDRAQLSAKLYQLSSLTWMQISQAPRHGLGTEIIPRNQIASPVPSSVTEDTSLLAFRFSGKKPMVGYRDGRVFHVLWLDWNFSLYPHGS